MSVQLEKVYLLNVLLYIDSLESVKKFITINKKCQEVSTMLRLYTKRRKYDSDSKENEKIIPKNLFTLFPMIQTIECDCYDISNNEEIMKNVTFIDLTSRSWRDEEIEEEIREKVRTLKISEHAIYSNTLPLIQLYPNCRTIVTAQKLEFKKIIGTDISVKLDKLIVKSKGYHEEFEELKKYTNIEEKVLIPEELKYFEMKTNNWDDDEEDEDIDGEELLQIIEKIFDNHPIKIIHNYGPIEYYSLESEEISVQNIMDNLNKYYHCCQINNIDLRQYTNLKRLSTYRENSKLKPKVLIEGLTNLESFGNIHICILDCSVCFIGAVLETGRLFFQTDGWR